DGAAKIAPTLGAGRRKNGHIVNTSPNSCALPAREEERLVLDNRSSDAAAVLITLEEVALAGKVVPGIKDPVAQELKDPTVELVRSRSRHHVDHRASIVSLRCRVVARLDAELLHCVWKWKGLVVLEIKVGVADAIQLERDLTALRTIGGESQSTRDRLPRLRAYR